MLKKVLVSLVIVSSFSFGASKKECEDYSNKLNHYYEKVNNNSNETKQYPLLMVKSYLDSLVLECKNVINISSYEKQIPTVKSLFERYVPKKIKDLDENKWKY